jgi:uncharacterized integral membrane protein (TIGR00697 family)
MMVDQAGPTSRREDAPQRQYRYLSWITIVYITFQLVSDVTAGKIVNFFGFPSSIAVLYFPITYIFSDILTEVYGYARARSVLWKVLFASVIAGLVYQIAAFWPPAEGFTKNQSYVDVFSQVPRILLGGWLAVFSGDIVNNYIMAKLKVLTDGKHLWFRAIASTIAGQGVNTIVFYCIALYAVIPTAVLLEAMITGWVLKSAVEAIFLPFTYAICNFLKRAEGVDVYDKQTDFNPFIFEIDSKLIETERTPSETL